ncbi:MAG: dTDP-4-dehydrorhamnose 3,5-epimerase (fragment) [Nitrospira sp.]
MKTVSSIKSEDLHGVGEDMYRMIEELYPICRSITGDGYRQTMKRIQEVIPISIHEVPSGTEVFDWTIPKEWNIRDAYVRGPSGKKVIDFQEHNLHLMQYSMPVRLKMPLQELKHHLYSLPGHPEWIPYRTSYYKEDWGFCLSQKQLDRLEEGEYEVVIDSSLEDGHLTYGEYRIQGESDEEVLLSCHCCHPSLCNDNLSGIALTSSLAEILAGLSLRHSYRFLFIPGAIGSIAWLAKNEALASRIKHGLVVTGVGDSGTFHYKKSRRGDAVIDRVVQHVLKHSGKPHHIRDFSPYGYDERQYCSPGFNLPVGSLTRTPHGSYPQYHTSADNLEFVSAEALADSISIYLEVVHVLENNRRNLNLNPKCEVRLGKRGLYRTVGGETDQPLNELATLWVLNLSDGQYSLLDIAERANLPFRVIHEAAERLLRHGLLENQSWQVT